MTSAAADDLRGVVRRLTGASRGVRGAIIGVFLLSIAARLALALAATPTFVSDARDYRALARNLLDGHGYMQVYDGDTQAFQGFTFRAFRPPGYPVFLAGVASVFGWNDYSYLFVNLVADLVTQVCFLLIAAHLLGAGPALFVQMLLAAHVLWMPNPMTESLYTALFAILALLVVFGHTLRTWRGALVFGLIAAAALFVRPITVCVWPVVLWHLVWKHRTRRGVALFALAVLPSVLGIGAWTWRNYRLFGLFVPFTTNLGHHNGWDYGLIADAEYADLRGEGLNEAQINQRLVQAELQIARENPWHWFMTIGTRIGELFSLQPPFEVRDVLWKHVLNRRASWIGRAYYASYAQYVLTYILAAAGAAVLLLRRQALGGLWLLLLCFIVTHVLLSRGDIRFLAPVYPVMCVLAGAFWAALAESIGAHREGPARSTQA